MLINASACASGQRWSQWFSECEAITCCITEHWNSVFDLYCHCWDVTLIFNNHWNWRNIQKRQLFANFHSKKKYANSQQFKKRKGLLPPISKSRKGKPGGPLLASTILVKKTLFCIIAILPFCTWNLEILYTEILKKRWKGQKILAHASFLLDSSTSPATGACLWMKTFPNEPTGPPVAYQCQSGCRSHEG